MPSERERPPPPPPPLGCPSDSVIKYAPPDGFSIHNVSINSSSFCRNCRVVDASNSNFSEYSSLLLLNNSFKRVCEAVTEEFDEEETEVEVLTFKVNLRMKEELLIGSSDDE
jgi:hypothetical protein